jgi:TolB protein
MPKSLLILPIFFICILYLFSCEKSPTTGNNDEIENDNYVITKITNIPHSVYNGVFTPDGSRIIYSVWASDTSEIHSVDVFGENDSLIVDIECNGITEGPFISPISGKIAFVVQYFNQDNQIKICNLDGSNLFTLVEKKGLLGGIFSPDETHYLYNWYHQMDNLSANSIWLTSLDGSSDSELTYGTNSIPIAFSSDGSQILYNSSFPNPNFRVFTMDLNGHDSTRITPDSLSLSAVCFSPSEDKILCQARISNPPDFNLNREIYIINVDGSNLQRLTNNDNQDYPVVFSPDGQEILYYSDLGTGGHEELRWEICTMNIDGSNQKRLTSNASQDRPIAYSQDGSKILFCSNSEASDKYSLYIMEVKQ